MGFTSALFLLISTGVQAFELPAGGVGWFHKDEIEPDNLAGFSVCRSSPNADQFYLDDSIPSVDRRSAAGFTEAGFSFFDSRCKLVWTDARCRKRQCTFMVSDDLSRMMIVYQSSTSSWGFAILNARGVELMGSTAPYVASVMGEEYASFVELTRRELKADRPNLHFKFYLTRDGRFGYAQVGQQSGWIDRIMFLDISRKRSHTYKAQAFQAFPTTWSEALYPFISEKGLAVIARSDCMGSGFLSNPEIVFAMDVAQWKRLNRGDYPHFPSGYDCSSESD